MTVEVATLPYPEPLRSSDGDFYDLVTTLFGDADKNPGGDKDFPLFINRNRVFVHERCHWLHHIGTTSGAFLSLLQFNRREFGLRWLKTIPLSVRQRLAESRRSSLRPFVPIAASDYRLLLPKTGEPEELDILRQNLYDGWLAWNFIYDSSRCKDIYAYKKPIELISLSLRDSLCRAKDYYSFDIDIPVDGKEMLRHESDNLFAHHNKHILTTSQLLESAAVANELLFLFQAKADKEYILERFNGAWSTWYCHAFRVYMAELNINPETFVGLMPYSFASFLLACDIALNPPLPPIELNNYSGSPDWGHIYPPLRFLSAIKAEKAPWLLFKPGDLDSHDAIKYHIDTITDGAGLELYTEYSAHVREGVNYSDMFGYMFTNLTSDLDEQRLKMLLSRSESLYDCISWLHNEAWTERSFALQRVVLPGYHLARFSHLSTDKDIGIVLPQHEIRPGLLAPPVVRNHNGELVNSNGVEAHYAYWYAARAFEEQLIYQFFFKVGPAEHHLFPKRLFPHDGGVFKSISQLLSNALGGSPW